MESSEDRISRNNDLFASNVLNQNSIFIEDIINKKKIKLSNDKKFRYKILKNYFISENLAYKNFIIYLQVIYEFN